MVSRLLKGAASLANCARKMAGPLIVFTVQAPIHTTMSGVSERSPTNPVFFLLRLNPTIVEHFAPNDPSRTGVFLSAVTIGSTVALRHFTVPLRCYLIR